MKHLLKILIYTLILNTSFSQNYHIKNFNRKSGLPHVQIFSLLQDSRDYLWVGTGGGLAFFDGKKFTRIDNNEQLPTKRFYDLIEDDNKIWVAGNDGIASISLNPKDEYSISILKNSKIDDLVLSIKKYSDVFFIGTRKNGLKRYKDGEISSIELGNALSNSQVTKISNHKNTIWVLCQNKALIKMDTLATVLDVYDESLFNDIRDFQIIDDENVMLLKSNSAYLFNYKNKKSSKIFDISKEYENLSFYSFNYYRDIYYITSNLGLFLINNDKVKLITISEGLLANSVTSLLIDREENIWIGSDSYGLNQLISPNIKNYTKNNGLLNPSINVIIDANDSILIGTDDGIYSLINNKIRRLEKYKEVQNSVVWDLAIDSLKNLWVATENGVIQYSKNKYIRINELDNIVTLNIVKDKFNQLWFCTVDGLYQYKNGIFKKISNKNITMGEVWDIAFDGEKYIIAAQEGLFSYNNIELELLHSSIQDVFCLYINSINDFYFGSETGLYRYNNNSIQEFKSVGLKGKIISNIFKNSNGDLWISHEDGLDLFNGQFVVEHMDDNDGFIGTEVTTNNAVLIKDNIFYIGFYGGVSEFNYINHLKITQPNIYIESVNAYNDSLSINLLKDNISLDHNYNQISFKFNTPWLKSAESIIYVCYLEGFEKQWKNSLTQGEITYHNLASGSYTFHVKSINHNNIESRNVAHFNITINDPYWKNPYIISLFIIFIILITFWTIRIYTEQINKKNIELERRVRLRTKELLKAKEYIEQIVEFAAIVIVTIDKKGKVVSWNKQGEFVFGYSKKEILSKHIKILDFVNDSFPFSDIFQQIDNESFVSEIEIIKQRANGSKAYLLFSASSIINSDGEKTGYTLIFSDLSHQKELQEKKEIHQKMMGGIDAINQLLGTMSHHINNSVASILSIIQLYEESHQFEEKVIEITKEHTNRINSVIKALKVLVTNLNLKTKNYAGSNDQVFDIDEDIEEFNKYFNKENKLNDNSKH